MKPEAAAVRVPCFPFFPFNLFGSGL